MSGNGNQVPLAPSQRGPGSYPRASTPHRPECYHPAGATGAAYMPSTAGGAQSSAQAALRVQPTPQPSAPPAPQQDMSKTTMAGHNYVSQPNQTPQARPQYPNFQYRAAQHGTRPNTHPRQQQPFIPGAAATATGPVMYHPTFVLGPTHMGIPPSYQQPRSSTPGYYQYVPYIGYSTPPSHTPQYYYTSNSQQLPTPNIQANAPGGRSNPTSLVGPQGSTATPTVPAATIPQPQAPAHMHQTMPGIRPAQQKRQSHRVPIIDPVTRQDIFSDLFSNDSQYLSGDSSERQTPQPEQTHSIAEEFTRMVNEVANQPTTCESATKSNYVIKNMDTPIPSSTSTVQLQSNAVTSINNNIIKSEILTINESKNVGPDVAVEPNETPVVSAISDSPVIVPKMPMNIKQLQKNSDQNIQSLVVDKNIPSNKQQKQNKNKPVVPQTEEIEKQSETLHGAPLANPISAPAAAISAAAPASAPASTAPPAPAAPTGPSVPAAVPVIPAAPFAAASHPTPASAHTPAPTPQPQRIPRERVRSEDKDREKSKDKNVQQEKEPPSNKPNGPTPAAVISSVDSFQESINLPTSQSSQYTSIESTKKQGPTKQLSSLETETPTILETKVESVNKSEPTLGTVPTPTQLLAASIEKIAQTKELPTVSESTSESCEASATIQAQAKLTQSIASCIRTIQPESKMKDINLNNKTTDPDTANGNTAEITNTDTVKEDVNKNDKVVKNTKNSNKKSGNKMANETNVKDAESFENGKDETDKNSNVEQDEDLSKNKDTSSKPLSAEKPDAPAVPPVLAPKYNYNPGQWSPFNKSGKKCYDIGLLKQMKDDPLSKNKPNVPLLEVCNVMRTAPMLEPLAFATISRPMNDSLFPQFAKSSGIGSRSGGAPRDPKKDGRNMATGGKGSAKLPSTPSSSGAHKPVIHVSLSLREEVKLNETKDPWKPLRFKRDPMNEDEFKTQELYKKFRGILNKLTPQKFDTLLDKVKTLEINTQKRLEGVIDLVFEKAIDEPNFSEAYAAMCNKLSMLKVPADNAPDQCVNFRALIISKCQNQFVTSKVDDNILKIEKEFSECTDPAKKKELHALLEEENRRVRMRSVGNVRFIGELYKLKVLTSKIMVYCMNYLIDKLEEEKLECLCKLLTTIGEQVEREVKEQLDNIFKKMQDIVERKSNKISSRVRFMIQDVIELRQRRWVSKSVVDSQPKMMDQIQKEAEQQQRHIELMNASTPGGFRRDEGGRGKRSDGRRQGSNSFMDNSWKSPRQNYTVDTSKLKAVTQKNQNLTNIKLAPHNTAWNHGSGTKNTAQAGSNSMISLSKNMYSVLENVQTDPTSLRANKDMSPSYHSKGASIERSTFNSRGDFNSGSGSKSGSMGVVRSNSGSRNTSATPPAPAPPAEAPAPAATVVPQERLPDDKRKIVKSTIELCLINPDDDEMVAEIKQRFPPQYHADVVTEILNVVLEKSARDVAMITKSMLHLITTNTIAPDNFLAGLKEILEFAPDLHIDIPMLYEYLGQFIAPQIEKKHITLVQILRLCENLISSNHGHLLLKAIIKNMKESMGPSFVKSKWQESGLQFKEWMNEDQVEKWLQDNKFEFLDGGAKACEENKKILSPAETQSKLLQLMNADENCDCIKGWVQDNLGKASNEDWFMRSLIQAICEHALFGAEGREVPHFNQDRMNKYSRLINEFGESQQAREASCLFGIQQLIHRLEHPQGLSLEIFQYLNDQYIISAEGFIAWEESELEPEGKGVMMKALTSFFTNIKEADNEDSCSED
ncbi:eukaryotic translation initiation factor 4 gamma 3-like isoform X2 [Pectinophora gossypiella]|uniref:eukaryotic translation initiation factor 4 gamma 3-like isoform X2 n=1 Tax=Pectinophora gossypiella TaxID=13191 RepID=UPI00214EEECB|nr:eukaryotic translation initiation factor 4 gamma 3-like isoform X2 [Pectinophora gossypiella]